LTATPQSLAVCAGTDAVFTVQVDALFGYDETVALGANGMPDPPGSAVFVPNNQPAPYSSTLTVGTAGAAGGNYQVDITGLGPTSTHTVTIGLDVFDSLPGAATLLSPPDGATGVNNQPILEWTAVSGAGQYLAEIAAEVSFTTIVYSATVSAPTHTVAIPHDTDTTYYWRVTAQNACGAGAPSAPFSFTTMPLPPAVVLSPEALESTLIAGTQATQTLTISNSGGSDLEWAVLEDDSQLCDGPVDLPWLSVWPTSGITAPATGTTVEVLLDATSLAAGVYAGALCIASNDPDTPLWAVPVTLTVETPDFKVYLPVALGS
jgi:hypothetical protein